MRAIVFIMTLSLISCSKVTFWTSGANHYPDSAPFVTEIQITDSSYTAYMHTWKGCMYGNDAFCEILESRHVGDTLFVYESRFRSSPIDSNSYVFNSKIKMAYFQKGKRLYPIYDHYPRLHSYSPLYEDNMDDIDSTAVQSITVNWEGWDGNEAYIDFNGGFHSQGKFKELREELSKREVSNDSVEWTIYYPNMLLDDSTSFRPYLDDKLGPLKNNGH
ncbi:MAG: hypothetical protein ACI8ZM_002100 [Crocinitomix sp.]|jgi:hypothetical protein